MSIQFAGVGPGDRLQIDDISSILGVTCSLSFWFRTTQVGTSPDQWNQPGIMGAESAGDGNDIFFGVLNSSGAMRLVVGNDTANLVSLGVVNDDAWHHAVFTRDSSTGEIKAYLDGILQATATSDTGAKTIAMTSIAKIDNAGGSEQGFFIGYLEDVRVYNRVLTLPEVETIRRSRGIDGIKNGLQARWLMNALGAGAAV